jgi:predicted nucleotidyltransferase
MNDLIAEIADRLSSVERVSAVALGGSYARGTQRPDSDIDLGLYYREDAAFSIQDIKKVAAAIDDEPQPVVTDFGRWGPWVNGGAWLTVKGRRVDFLYRNLDRLERVIEECWRGEFESDFYQQAPYGFHSYIYLGELSVCKTLYDPEKVLARLKERLLPYPPPLKKSIIQRFLWSVEFDLAQAEKFAAQGDVYNAVGCFARCGAALVEVAYALNERYFLTDKGALAEIGSFAVKPEGFGATLEAVLSHPGATRDELSESALKLNNLFKEMVEVCGGLYSRPDFRS